MRIGTVISSEIAVNTDGEDPVLLLQVEISEEDDVQTVEYMQAAGVDYRPPAGANVVVNDLGEAWKISLGAEDGIVPESAEGEYEIYASDGVDKKGRLKCNLDGTVQAGVTGLDFVGQDGKILSELQAIKADFDALKTAYDTHTHLHSPGPSPPAPTAPPAAPAPTPHTPASVASSNFKSED